MDIKKFEQFSARDQVELTKMLLELQKLAPPKQRGEDEHPNTSFAGYEFYLGRGKQFKVTRIK